MARLRPWRLELLLENCKETVRLRRWRLYSRSSSSSSALDCCSSAAMRADLAGVELLQSEQARFARWVSLLKHTTSLSHARTVHAHITTHRRDRTTFLANWLVHTYGDCGSLEDAQAAFDHIPNPNLHSWSVLMAAYTKNGCAHRALDCFHHMLLQGLRQNHVTFVCAVDACGCLGALEKGREIHSAIVDAGFDADVSVGTALVSMYGKCGSLEDARRVFQRMPVRNVISWNAIISACTQNGNAREALELFQQMQQVGGLKPDAITFVCAIDACADVAALEKGQQIHALVRDCGCEGELNVANALINLYGKCGSLPAAKALFGRMPQRDVISWNAMISACARSGHHREALDLYHQMQQQGIKPDQITFLGVLTACSHSGQVGVGKHYFNSMISDHSLKPKLEHYVCLIDALARSGSLAEAEDLISTTPFKDEATIWLCLLGACKIHGDVERGLRVASKIFQLDPENASPYVLLSSTYAAAGKWDEARRVREALTKSAAITTLSLNDFDKLVQKSTQPQGQEPHAT